MPTHNAVYNLTYSVGEKEEGGYGSRLGVANREDFFYRLYICVIAQLAYSINKYKKTEYKPVEYAPTSEI